MDSRKPILHVLRNLKVDLEKALGVQVDLVSRGGIKPRYYKAIEPDLIDV